MNKLRTMQVTAAAVICGVSGAVVAHDRTDCSLRTLKGDYVFSASGHSLNAAGVWLPKAIVEYIHFNGDGTLSVTAATVANAAGNGQVTRSPPGGTGTYSLDVNCTGTLQFGPPGPGFDIFVAPKGREFWMIQTLPNPGNAFQGHVKRVS